MISKKRFVLNCVIALSAQTAFGMYGDYTTPSLNPSICRIVIFDKQDQFSSFCSATLISPTELASAAHCFKRVKSSDKITVRCGFTGFDQNQVVLDPSGVYLEGPQFKEQLIVQRVLVNREYFSSQATSDDAAKIILQYKSKLQTINLGQVPRESEIQKQCRVVGYGYDSNGVSINLNESPILQSFDLQMQIPGYLFAQTRIRLASQEEGKFWQDFLLDRSSIGQDDKIREKFGHDKIPVVITAGDSGGALLCPTKEAWELVGVIIGSSLGSGIAGNGTNDYYFIDSNLNWNLPDFAKVTYEIWSNRKTKVNRNTYL